MKKEKSLRICSEGHNYFKSSNCPTCPVCEKESQPTHNFLTLLSSPARRALENAKLNSLDDLSRVSEKELLSLHGFGPASVPKLKEALLSAGLTFKKAEINKLK